MNSPSPKSPAVSSRLCSAHQYVSGYCISRERRESKFVTSCPSADLNPPIAGFVQLSQTGKFLFLAMYYLHVVRSAQREDLGRRRAAFTLFPTSVYAELA